MSGPWLKAGGKAVAALALVSTVTACSDVFEGQSDAAPAVQADARRVFGGQPRKGRALIAEIGCGACHRIPGVQGAYGIVGPPLDGFSQRQLIGGIVPNEPGILVRWVKDAPSLAPQTGMPRFALSDDQAKHIAAYLYTLR